MRLLDLFCGAGGAGMGYHRAGFEVVGVDIKPQPHYPFEFHQGDALEYLAEHGREFDVIHASPPCQAYSRIAALATAEDYPKLVEPVRTALIKSGLPYVIENVPGAPLLNPMLLCGTMFNLPLYRHRLFETNFPLPFIWEAPHGKKQDRIHGKDRRRDIVLVVGKGQYKGYRKRASEAMGIDWMLEQELAEAIPPAYTEYIDKQLMQHLLPN
jgi:DNA (cytosine-5)-methyltransferase 1